LIGAAYILSLIYFLLYQGWKRYDRQAYIQIFFDLMWTTAIVYISGGLAGSFYFIYVFAIIAASIVISGRASYLTAAMSCVFFGGLVSMMYNNLIPVYGADGGADISLARVIITITVSWSVFFLVAFLMNYLTGSLRRTREALELAERELELKKNLALMGDVSAHLAHEIRNPLAAISGSIQVLRNEMSLSADQEKLMDIVVSESRRVSFSLEQFLNLATPARPTFTQMDLSGIISETITLLQAGGELNGRFELAGNYQNAHVKYLGNSSQFKQVFWNLFRNALKAMPEGGLLSINLEQRDKEAVCISIRDTGRGIPSSDREKVFQPFYSGFKDGWGLGMSVVRRIIDDYNGKIDVFSEPNQGTEITLTLPL